MSRYGTPTSERITVDNSSNATKYSTPISQHGATGFSWHLLWTGSGVTTAVTIWASNKPKPSLADDTDWVQQTDITITGPTAQSSYKTSANVGNANFYWYRLKLVTSAGNAVVDNWSLFNKPA